MPSEDASRFELAIYVEPEHYDVFKDMMADGSETCFMLDVERLAGLHIANKTEELQMFRSNVSRAQIDYGMDVAEVSDESRG